MDSFSYRSHEPRSKSASIDGFFRPSNRPNHNGSRPKPAANRLRLEQHAHAYKDRVPVRTPTSVPSYTPSINAATATPSLLNSSRPQNRHQKKAKGRLPWRRIAAGGVASIYLIMVLSGGWIGWKFLKDTSKVFGGSFAGNIGDLLS